jgi:hypothetical protein
MLIHAVSIFVCKNELHIDVLVSCVLVTCYILHSPGLGDPVGHPITPDAWCTVHFSFIAKYLGCCLIC